MGALTAAGAKATVQGLSFFPSFGYGIEHQACGTEDCRIMARML